MLLTHLRRHGHQALPLVGGATGMIGDPSGKTSERTLLDGEKVLENTAKIRGPDSSASSPTTRGRR